MAKTTACHFASMPDILGYLERLSKPLQEKLRVAFWLKNAKSVLDVGCADGSVTIAMAKMFPDKKFVGIDLDAGFIRLANEKAKAEGLTNVDFRRSRLRHMLGRKQRFDAVLFCSVLHEFWTYGEGTSSVVKALSDAHEMLNVGGIVVVRDMILDDYTKRASLLLPGIRHKVLGRIKPQLVADFASMYGDPTSIYQLNHLLLKYMYEQNWQRELAEHYVAITVEQYKDQFRLLGMEVEHVDAYTIPYLAQKWKEDFDLDDVELAALRSTTIIVAKKWSYKERRFDLE